MSFVTIHRSGDDADALRVDSWHNGADYAVHFGENGHPSMTLFLQGDDATDLRDTFDHIEGVWPHMDTREVWMKALDPYL